MTCFAFFGGCAMLSLLLRQRRQPLASRVVIAFMILLVLGGFTLGVRQYRAMKPAAIEHYAAAAHNAFQAGNAKDAAEEAQRVLRLAPGHAGAMQIVDTLHRQYRDAALAALAAADAKAAMDNAQNAINLKGRESDARDLLAEAKALQKAQNKAAKAESENAEQ